MIGRARYPRIRLALINITKKMNLTKVDDPKFISKMKDIVARLEATIAHLKQLIEEKEAGNGEE